MSRLCLLRASLSIRALLPGKGLWLPGDMGLVSDPQERLGHIQRLTWKQSVVTLSRSPVSVDRLYVRAKAKHRHDTTCMPSEDVFLGQRPLSQFHLILV